MEKTNANATSNKFYQPNAWNITITWASSLHEMQIFLSIFYVDGTTLSFNDEK